MHPQPLSQQQRDELFRKEEARREEQERQSIEALLNSFDAYGFYQAIDEWTNIPVPRPIQRMLRFTPMRTKVVVRQPIPLSNKELAEMKRLSSECLRLLSILRLISQRGIECPYIHQVNRSGLERAIEKCQRLTVASIDYGKQRGFLIKLFQLLLGTSIGSIKRDVESFRKHLEAVLMVCRHEEFARDLRELRQTMSGWALNPVKQATPLMVRQSKPGVVHRGMAKNMSVLPSPTRGRSRS